MYKLKNEWISFFKEIRTRVYADFIGCDYSHASSVVNSSKVCSENFAKSLISVRHDMSFKDEKMPILLEKYFAKEK